MEVLIVHELAKMKSCKKSKDEIKLKLNRYV